MLKNVSVRYLGTPAAGFTNMFITLKKNNLSQIMSANIMLLKHSALWQKDLALVASQKSSNWYFNKILAQ